MLKDNHTIVKGIVDLKRLVRSNLKGHAKSWHDIGMYQLKVMLKSKATKHSMKYEEVSEKELKSTQTCSCYGSETRHNLDSYKSKNLPPNHQALSGPLSHRSKNMFESILNIFIVLPQTTIGD